MSAGLRSSASASRTIRFFMSVVTGTFITAANFSRLFGVRVD